MNKEQLEKEIEKILLSKTPYSFMNYDGKVQERQMFESAKQELLSLFSKYADEKTNPIYWERNQLITLLAKIFPSHLYTDPSEPEWPVVCVHLPTGTCSWHLPAKEITGYLLNLESTSNDWDGHTTEEKYKRVEQFKQQSTEVKEGKK